MKSNIEFLYEELRKATDGGSESMTHDDALKQIAYWRDKCSQVQQVAVPDKREPLTFDQIDALENRVYMQTTHKGRPMLEYVNAIIRAVEAHHGITGAKP